MFFILCNSKKYVFDLIQIRVFSAKLLAIFKNKLLFFKLNSLDFSHLKVLEIFVKKLLEMRDSMYDLVINKENWIESEREREIHTKNCIKKESLTFTHRFMLYYWWRFVVVVEMLIDHRWQCGK